MASILLFCISDATTAAYVHQSDSLVIISKYGTKDSFAHIINYSNKFGDCPVLENNRSNPKKIIKNFRSTIIVFAGTTKFMEFYPVYVRPNQTVIINETDSSFIIEGTSNCETDILHKLNKHNRLIFYNSMYNDWKQIKNFDKQLSYFKARFNEQISILYQLKDSCYIEEDFIKCVEKKIYQSYLMDLLSPIIEGGIKSDELPDSYIETLDKLKLIISSMVDDYGFLHFQEKVIFHYNQFFCRKYLNTKMEFQSQWDTAKTVYNSKTKEFLMFSLLKNYYGKKVKNFKNYLLEFKLFTNDEDYVRYLDSLGKINNHRFSENEIATYLTDSNGYDISWKEVLQKNKSKILYVDFWATWCRPCKEEMQHYPVLMKDINNSYENAKKTNFIFISIDHDIEKWLLAIKKLNIDVSNIQHYLLDRSTPLAKFFKLNSIPHYAIIDETGKLVSYDAPRPSNPKTVSLLTHPK